MTRQQLPQYVLDALNALGGEATIVAICKYIWDNEISQIPANQRTDLFYTWGYDVRWAGQWLRNNNQSHIPRKGIWALGPAPVKEES